MSAMSNLAIQHDEARDLSGIDLVECERDHYKDLCNVLLKACEAALVELCSWELDPELDTAADVVCQLEEAIAKVKAG